MSLDEQEIRKLGESFSKLREDLLPIYRIVKESKPLPTPDHYTRSTTPPVPSPTYTASQVIRRGLVQADTTFTTAAIAATAAGPAAAATAAATLTEAELTGLARQFFLQCVEL